MPIDYMRIAAALAKLNQPDAPAVFIVVQHAPSCPSADGGGPGLCTCEPTYTAYDDINAPAVQAWRSREQRRAAERAARKAMAKAAPGGKQ